jgi:hypothetical protein
MAIGKITRGNGFYGLLNYLLDADKDPIVISGCTIGSKPDDIAREFRQVANLRPGVEKPVRHFSISFAPEDGNVEDIVKEAIALRVLDSLGYDNCQYMAIGHRRDQKGHDEVHNHDHMHIVTNAVTLEGEHVDGSFERYKIQEVLRELESEFGLKQIKSSWEVKHEKGQEINRSSEIAQLVAASLENKPSLAIWLDRLTENSIDVRFNLTDKGVVKGITFIKDGEAHKGSSIGAKWSRYKGTKKPSNLDEGCLIVSEIVQISPEDIPLMKAANLKSQQHPVRLNEVDRAMFDRVVEMAEMAVLNQGRNRKFRNGRVEIAIDDDRMKVRRVRPEKLMLEATKVDGQWQVVGFPNIIKVDVQLLERVNGVEGMDFKKIERISSTVSEKPHTKRIVIDEPEVFPDDDLDLISMETTPKIRLQAAIDWAAEEATERVEEYIEYLVEKEIKVKFVLDGNENIGITYELEEVEFEDTELVDASLSLLESARGLSFDVNRLISDIELAASQCQDENMDSSELNEIHSSQKMEIKTTKIIDNKPNQIRIIIEEGCHQA